MLPVRPTISLGTAPDNAADVDVDIDAEIGSPKFLINTQSNAARCVR